MPPNDVSLRMVLTWAVEQQRLGVMVPEECGIAVVNEFCDRLGAAEGSREAIDDRVIEGMVNDGPQGAGRASRADWVKSCEAVRLWMSGTNFDLAADPDGPVRGDVQYFLDECAVIVPAWARGRVP